MLHPTHHGIGKSFKHILAHVSITLLAVGIAFSLPVAARFILYKWWPSVEGNSELLLITEVTFAAALVLLFNVSKLAWDSRRVNKVNSLAALVHATKADDPIAGREARHLHDKLRGTRDVSVLSITGAEMHDKDGWLKRVLDDCHEVRVLLMNPAGEGSSERGRTANDVSASTVARQSEIEATIACLKELADAGKQVRLKFYDTSPFWKLVVTGDHVWVQFCHAAPVVGWPEYVFNLRKEAPKHGFFAPFYVHFLNQWNDPRFPEYSFETRELVYRSADGSEAKRLPFSSADGLAAQLNEAKPMAIRLSSGDRRTTAAPSIERRASGERRSRGAGNDEMGYGRMFGG